MRNSQLAHSDKSHQSSAAGDVIPATAHEINGYFGLNSSGVLTTDYLPGVTAIANFLGWSIRKVRYARETGGLPIRVKSGIGLYAFKSEIVAALKTPDTLVPKAPDKAH